MGDNIDFEGIIRHHLRKQLDDEFTEYKKEKLKEMNIEIESKRNRIIQNILDSVTISVEREMKSMTPNISIFIRNN